MKKTIPGTLFAGVMFILVGLCSLQNSSAQTQPELAAPEPSAQPAAPPPDILPASPLAQVIRLTQAGVDQSVIMNYVTGSTSTFNLDSDKIIYLSNLGVPNDLVNAMMQRDQQLQQQLTAQAAQQAQQQPPPSEPPSVNPADVAPQPETPPAPVTVDYFNNTLAPYGNWVIINGYGRCWRPTAVVYNPNWQPYCDHGQWVYTDCGWYWDSSYAWGATFHYGRWFQDPSFGWCWYPDTVWAPSWVTWRYSDNYCGWAPLPPGAVYQMGVGIVFNGSSVSASFSFGLGASAFIFVPTQNFCDPHPRNYCVPQTQVTQIYNSTTVINNYNVNNRTLINHGIPAQHIATITRTTLRPVPVREINNRPMNNYPGAYNRAGYNHPAYSSSENSAAMENHYQPTAANQNLQPSRNWTEPQTAQQERNNMNATASQRPAPTRDAPVQTPPPNSNEQSAPARWQDSQPTGTPRTTERPSEARQNYSEPASKPTGLTYSPSPAPSQSSGGSHGGNQNWPGH